MSPLQHCSQCFTRVSHTHEHTQFQSAVSVKPAKRVLLIVANLTTTRKPSTQFLWLQLSFTKHETQVSPHKPVALHVRCVHTPLTHTYLLDTQTHTVLRAVSAAEKQEVIDWKGSEKRLDIPLERASAWLCSPQPLESNLRGQERGENFNLKKTSE